MRCLIIGQKSFLGQRLYTALIEQGEHVYGTSRGEKDKTAQILEFDLSSNRENWPSFPDQIESVFLSAALTNQKVIEENQEHARLVNVEKTLEIVDFFLKRESHIVFPSTNLVLANEVPSQKIDAPYKPLSLYAGFKAEVERKLLEKQPQATICRLPKILDFSTPLIQNWCEKLKAKEQVQALTDLIVAPVSVSYAIKILCKVMKMRPGGIIQMGGEEVSYFDIAQLIAEKLGVSRKLVIPQTSEEIGISLASNPRHPSLDTSRTEESFGIPAQSLDDFISDIIA